MIQDTIIATQISSAWTSLNFTVMLEVWFPLNKTIFNAIILEGEQSTCLR